MSRYSEKHHTPATCEYCQEPATKLAKAYGVLCWLCPDHFQELTTPKEKTG